MKLAEKWAAVQGPEDLCKMPANSRNTAEGSIARGHRGHAQFGNGVVELHVGSACDGVLGVLDSLHETSLSSGLACIHFLWLGQCT